MVEATYRDLELLKELCDLVRNASLCGLGQSAPQPVLSTLRYFEHEYLDKLIDGPLAMRPPRLKGRRPRAMAIRRQTRGVIKTLKIDGRDIGAHEA